MIRQISVAAALAALSAPAFAQAPGSPGYLSSPTAATVVTNAFGECWKTSSWTPDHAVVPCDPVKVAAPAAPLPAPQAKPQPAPLAAAPAPVIEKVTLDADVLFEFDKAELRPQGREKIDELAARLKDADVESISLVGYADPIGAETYNRKLSQARAEAVKEHLAQAVQRERVQAEGRGETSQFADCKGVKGQKLIDCLQPNRRVDVEVRGTRVAGGQSPASVGR